MMMNRDSLLLMIRADTQVRPYKNSLTLSLSQRERGLGIDLPGQPG